jgi:hypothetical protein
MVSQFKNHAESCLIISTYAVLSEVLLDGGGLGAVKPQWVQLR